MISVLTDSLRNRSFQEVGLSLPARYEVDWRLLVIAAALISIGVVMVASASMSVSESIYGNPWHLFQRHCIYLGLGIAAAAVVAMVPIRIWQQYSWLLLLLSLVLLTLVLVPGIGHKVNGSQRWLMLGPITMQPSEAAKFMLIIFFANYFARRHVELKNSWQGVFKPLAILSLVTLLLLLEPDFGTAVVIATAIVAMMFVVGVKLWQFATLVVSGVGAMALVAVLSPYRMQRLITFLDPWSDQFNSGYQLTQSLIAFGQGQWLGVGLGKSVQKLFYLPDAHTDFMFAIVAEEFGIVGSVIVLGLFAALVYRMFKLSRRAMLHNNSFVCLSAFGIGVLFAAQAFINMGVAAGLLPTKGLTLPFISYGGSSVIVSCALVALVLRFDWELLGQPTKRRR